MSQDDSFGRIRILPNSNLQNELQISSAQTASWQAWLQQARSQDDGKTEEKKKIDEKKQIEKEIARKNAEAEFNKKAQQYLQLAFNQQQLKEKLNTLNSFEELGLIERPVSFWSRRAQRYKDWLLNNAKQQLLASADAERAKKAHQDDRANSSQNTEAEESSSIEQAEQTEPQTEQQIKKGNRTQTPNQNKEVSNQRNEATQESSRSTQQQVQLVSQQDKDKKEAAETSTAAQMAEPTQLAAEDKAALGQSEAQHDSANTQPPLMQAEAAQPQEAAESAAADPLDSLALNAAGALKPNAAKVNKGKKDELNEAQLAQKEEAGETEETQEETGTSTEQNADANGADILSLGLTKNLEAPAEKGVNASAQGNSSNAHASPQSTEAPADLAGTKSIHALTTSEFLSKTGPMAALIEAVTKFCCNRAINALGEWELTIDLDPERLPGTQLVMCISVSELLLRFTVTDEDTKTLICRHSKALHYKLTKLMKQYEYPRSVKLELNGNPL